jgi:hypothetical protein
VASDPKTETTSVSAQEYSQDTEASMSSPSNVATEPVSEEPVPLGSPMKVSSPTPGVLKVSGSTTTRPTRSSSAKVVLPKTPSKTRFHPKSASPSPTRLVRSTSMISTRQPGMLWASLAGGRTNSLDQARWDVLLQGSGITKAHRYRP